VSEVCVSEMRAQRTGAPRFSIRGSRFATPRARLALAVLAILVALSASCGTPPDPDQAYIRTLQVERASKDAGFQSAANSPIPTAARATYLPLKYFAPDAGYIVPASFTAAPARTPAKMPTSTGQVRDMELVGTLEFTLKGMPMSLSAFVEADTPPDRLFVPFTDLTSGTETYSAGRYLEIDRTRTGIYTIDFNRAFNPYCYYNHEYDCPYPPKENRLAIPIHAGEKLAQTAIPAR